MKKETKTNIFTFKNIFIVALIIALLYLLTCNKKTEVAPIVKPISEQREVVRIDSMASQKFRDSVQRIIFNWEHEAKKWQSNWETEVNENADLYKKIDEIITEPVPDTCKPYQQKLLNEYNQLVRANQAKDNAASQTINSKNKIINEKDVLIAQSKKDYSKLRINLDTCFAQQKTLEAYAKKIKPRNQVYVGITAIGNTNKYYEGVGLNLGLKNKRGYMFEVGALQMGTVTQFTLGLKKVISLRK